MLSEPCVASPEVEIRRRIETGQTFTLHECAPSLPHTAGALGVCELVGTAERPPREVIEEKLGRMAERLTGAPR